MDVSWTFGLWTNGDYDETLTMSLESDRSYLVETFLVKTDGEDYAHAYIAEVCRQAASDVIQCGITPEGDAASVAVVDSAVSVTVGLRTMGGSHRAEGVVFVR